MNDLLILSPRYTPDSINLRREALNLGWEIERLQDYRVNSTSYEEKNIALYGEALFTTIVAEQISHTLLEAPANWLENLPEKYLNRNLTFTTLQNVRNITVPKFIKPAEGKSFQAQIYHSSNELPSPESQSDNMPVYLSEPVEWLIEFRCFILERTLATLSIYSRNGEIAEDENGMWIATEDEISKATEFINSILNNNNIHMPPAFVIDVGHIKGRGWAIVEANPAWASGIYGCVTSKILPILQRSCVLNDAISSEDEIWEINRYYDD